MKASILNVFMDLIPSISFSDLLDFYATIKQFPIDEMNLDLLKMIRCFGKNKHVFTL